MKFNIFYKALKPWDSSDSTSQLYLYQISCDFIIHEACNKTFASHNMLPCILSP
jgi:hypothetical protein